MAVDGRLVSRAALVTLGTLVALGVDGRLAVLAAVAGSVKVVSTPRGGLVPMRSLIGL